MALFFYENGWRCDFTKMSNFIRESDFDGDDDFTRDNDFVLENDFDGDSDFIRDSDLV